eukprot:366390-Chlamydomonas_euryale.AAC.7
MFELSKAPVGQPVVWNGVFLAHSLPLDPPAHLRETAPCETMSLSSHVAMSRGKLASRLDHAYNANLKRSEGTCNNPVTGACVQGMGLDESACQRHNPSI